MHVFYEDEGSFRVGTILADNNTSLQIETAHGKRVKVKAANVLFRFGEPGVKQFMDHAGQLAAAIDTDFLWQCCGPGEFDFDALGRDYFGHAPDPLESAGLLIRLHDSPIYFYKKGRGRYKAAPEDALKAALASVERKRQQALQQERYMAQLLRFELPAEFVHELPMLLYKPDRTSVAVKALEAASAATKLGPVRLLEKCGAVPSSRDFHLNRFLFEHFPHGTQHPEVPELPADDDLPRAEVSAFSIDDITTTEIDDAFSVTRLPGGNWRIGVHIAAPALGVTPGSIVDESAAQRLSTVYMPGAKITMLPDAVIDRYSLAEGHAVPALSLYLELRQDLTLLSTDTRLERVPIAANLRLDALDRLFSEEALQAGGEIVHSHGSEIRLLWEFACVLEAGRGRPEQPRALPMDYSFYVTGERVHIVPRRRGSPIDKLVAELMIFVNTEWGRTLVEQAAPGIYRSQGGGTGEALDRPHAPRRARRGSVSVGQFAPAPLRGSGQPTPTHRRAAAASAALREGLRSAALRLAGFRGRERRLYRLPAHHGALLVSALVAAGGADGVRGDDRAGERGQARPDPADGSGALPTGLAADEPGRSGGGRDRPHRPHHRLPVPLPTDPGRCLVPGTGKRAMAWARRLLTSRANSLEYGEVSTPHTPSPETVSRRRPTQSAPRRRASAPPSLVLSPAARSIGALSPDYSWIFDPANRTLLVAIVISILVHAVVLKIHFIDPRGKMSDMFQPTLEVVLVNTRTTSAPKKAEVLAQANLDGGGNTDAARRAKTPLPPQPREQPVAEVTVSTRKLEQKEEQANKKLLATASKEVLAHEPELKPEPQRVQEAMLRPDAADLLARSLEAARLQAEIDRNLDAYSKRPRRSFVGSRAREFRFARYVEDWRIKVERVGNMNYPTQARQQKIYGSLQLTVSIKSDGTVESIDINKPSGQAILDDAARRIVALAGPYAPFPPEIAKDTDILSITRTWTFTPADELVSQ